VAYSSRATVKASLSIPDSVTSEDDAIDAALDAASLQIDSYCGRTFVTPGSATARVFNPGYDVCDVDDIAQTTGLIVKTDTDNDGTFATTLVLTTDYILENNAAPYRRVREVGGAGFPRFLSNRPTVQVTAFWSYAMTVPATVTQAATILASRLYERRGTPLGIVAGFEGESVRISHRDPDMRALLAGYRLIGTA
jgi:hypothetical protein